MADEQTQQTGETGETGADERKFTQADLDRIVQERLARHESKPADYDDLKAKAEQFDALQDEQKTEHEKALSDAVQAARDEVYGEVMAERVLDKIEVAAAGEFADVQDARLRLRDRTDEFVTDEGSIDAEAIAEAVKGLLEDAPHLRKADPKQTRRKRRQEVGLGSKGGEGRQKFDSGRARLEHAYSEGNDN